MSLSHNLSLMATRIDSIRILFHIRFSYSLYSVYTTRMRRNSHNPRYYGVVRRVINRMVRIRITSSVRNRLLVVFV